MVSGWTVRSYLVTITNVLPSISKIFGTEHVIRERGRESTPFVRWPPGRLVIQRDPFQTVRVWQSISRRTVSQTEYRKYTSFVIEVFFQYKKIDYSQRCHFMVWHTARRVVILCRRQGYCLPNAVHCLAIVDDDQHNVSSQPSLDLLGYHSIPLGVDVEHWDAEI